MAQWVAGPDQQVGTILPIVASIVWRKAQARGVSVLLCGMETHVCVFQTARDLLERGAVPFLCADAILSRSDEDRRFGLKRCRALGAVVTTVEGALFDLLGRAGA